MYNISFVNPNFQVGPRELNAYFLPYSTGMIWSYAQSFTDIKSKFQVADWIWRRDPISDTVKILAKSNIVGFSTYIWNKKYNYRLAQEVKVANPDCLIVFGGPEPPITDKNFFEKFPYIDVVIKQEGELSFKAILDNFETANYTSIPGLLVNIDGQTVDTGDSIRMSDLDSIPSPYLTGIFDQLMASHPDVKWNAILESNRGCPYQCTFCDWGSLTYQKVKKFDLQRVLEELEWLGKNKIGFISVADANFGMFPERDNVIADKLIEIQKNYGWPTSYTLSYAKNQRAEVIDICHKLVTHGSRVGLTVGVQSMTEGVLDIIKRKNLKMNEVKIVFDECDRRDIPVFTELIIGLPGETLQSWRENFWRLFRLNNHTGITVYSAMLLENSEMTLGQKTLYGLESVEVKDYLVGSDDKDDIVETVQLIKCTRTMPFDDIIQGFLFTWFLNTTHINGLTNFLARFAYAYAGIDYEKFYTDLEQFLDQDPWWNKQKSDTESYYRHWLTHGSVDHPPIGTTPVYGTNLMLRTSIAIHEQNQYQHIYNLIESYYRTHFSSQGPYINDLFAIQKSYFINYDDLQSYPKKITTSSNILGFIQYGAELDIPAAYEFDWPEDPTMSRQRFCENLWYARRRNFGKATIRYC